MDPEHTIIGFIEPCAGPTFGRRLDVMACDLDDDVRGIVLAAKGYGTPHMMVGEPEDALSCPDTGTWAFPSMPPFCPGCGQRIAEVAGCVTEWRDGVGHICVVHAEAKCPTDTGDVCLYEPCAEERAGGTCYGGGPYATPNGPCDCDPCICLEGKGHRAEGEWRP